MFADSKIPVMIPESAPQRKSCASPGDFGLVHGIGLDIPSGSSEAYRSMANLHDCDDVSKLVELCRVHFAVQCLLEPGQAEHELK